MIQPDDRSEPSVEEVTPNVIASDETQEISSSSESHHDSHELSITGSDFDDPPADDAQSMQTAQEEQETSEHSRQGTDPMEVREVRDRDTATAETNPKNPEPPKATVPGTVPDSPAVSQTLHGNDPVARELALAATLKELQAKETILRLEEQILELKRK